MRSTLEDAHPVTTVHQRADLRVTELSCEPRIAHTDGTGGRVLTSPLHTWGSEAVVGLVTDIPREPIEAAAAAIIGIAVAVVAVDIQAKALCPRLAIISGPSRSTRHSVFNPNGCYSILSRYSLHCSVSNHVNVKVKQKLINQAIIYCSIVNFVHTNA